MSGIGRQHNGLSLLLKGGCLPIMNAGGGQQVQARMVVFSVIPAEEGTRPVPRGGGRGEAIRIIRLVLEGFEMRLAEGIIVGGMGTAVTFTDPQIQQQLTESIPFIGLPLSAWSVSWLG